MYVGVAVKEDKVGEISLKSVGIGRRDLEGHVCLYRGAHAPRQKKRRRHIAAYHIRCAVHCVPHALRDSECLGSRCIHRDHL